VKCTNCRIADDFLLQTEHLELRTINLVTTRYLPHNNPPGHNTLLTTQQSTWSQHATYHTTIHLVTTCYLPHNNPPGHNMLLTTQQSTWSQHTTYHTSIHLVTTHYLPHRTLYRYVVFIAHVIIEINVK